MNIYLYDNSIDGFFSAVFQAYEERHPHNENKIAPGPIKNYELFANYIQVKTNYEHSKRVIHTLQTQFGYETYYDLHAALLCEAPFADGIADSVYHTIVLGLFENRKKEKKFSSKHAGTRYDQNSATSHMCHYNNNFLNYLTVPYVYHTFQCMRPVKREAGHLFGFLRFKELSNEVMFATINPNNNVLTILMDHFENRFPLQNYMIYDEVRDIAALHAAKQSSILITHPQLDEPVLKNYSASELQYEELWKEFFQTIAIKTRENPKLQQNNIAKHYWKNTIEFNQ